MALREEFKNQGFWLFRWRSYLPLLLLPILLISLRTSRWIDDLFGEIGDRLWDLLCLTISLTGLAIRVYVGGTVPPRTSGRNTKQHVADTLNTTGLYSKTRNPLYLGNYLIFLGFLLATEVWWFVIMMSLLFALYYERIIFTEEDFLREKFGSVYENYSKKTPVFWPGGNPWVKPELTFDWRVSLRKEYTTFLILTATFFVIDILSRLVVERRFEIDRFWLNLFLVGGAVHLVCWSLRKITRFFVVEGR